MEGIITHIQDLNKCIGRPVYIILEDNCIIASTNRDIINKHLSSDDSIITLNSNVEELRVLYGIVLNPEQLPFTTPKLEDSPSLWILEADSGGEDANIEWECMEDMESVIDTIETSLEINPNTNIENYAVILAEEYELGLQVPKVDVIRIQGRGYANKSK
jgi:hypothetical protein